MPFSQSNNALPRPKSSTPIAPSGSADDAAGEVFAAELAAGLGARNVPRHAQVQQLDLVGAARACLLYRGVDSARFIPAELAVERAIAAGGYENMNSPASFPNVLSAAAGKLIAEPDHDSVETYPYWAYRLKPVADFKPRTLLTTGEFGELPLHTDGDVFEQSTFAEAVGEIQVESYADEFALTPRMAADDDANVFGEALRDKASAHDQTLNRLCCRLLGDNATLSDTYQLFDLPNHANDRVAGGPPSETELDAMRALLRAQLGPSGVRPMGYGLDLIVVPSALETTTEKLLGDFQVVPVAAADAEIYRGRTKFAVEPMLSAWSTTAWYAFAAPNRGRAVVYVHQIGYEKMKIRTYTDPRTNSIVFQFEGRFAAAVRNHRAVARNAGTGA